MRRPAPTAQSKPASSLLGHHTADGAPIAPAAQQEAGAGLGMPSQAAAEASTSSAMTQIAMPGLSRRMTASVHL